MSHPGIRIGLLVADDTTLIYSPTPSLIEAESEQLDKPNAIVLHNKVPPQLANACAATVASEGGFLQRLARLNHVLGFGNDFVRIDYSGRDYHAAREKLLRQFANFRALIKDGLGCFVGSGNLVFGVGTKPTELLTLQPHQVCGFGNERPALWIHRRRRGPRRTTSYG